MPRQFSVITKVVTFLFIFTMLGAVWKSTSIYLDDSGVVAGEVTSNASVEQNEINTLNAQLQKKEAELRQQEIDLLTIQRDRDERTMVTIFTLASALFALILINFYLDYRRYHFRFRRA